MGPPGYGISIVLLLDDNSDVGTHDKEQSLLFELLNAFYEIGKSHKSHIFIREDIFSFTRGNVF